MLNNLEIKKYLGIILATLLALAALVGLGYLGLDIPILRQIVGFIFLTFVPGLLILRILRLHRLGAIESLLYSVGLSIAFVMFLGFFINMLYPVLGTSKPISIYPVIITITVVVLILCAIAYKRESSEKEPRLQNSSIQWSGLLSPPALLLLLLPALSALGAFWVYLYQGNTVLLILFSLITFIVALIAFGKFIPMKLYPLAVIAISIALLWQHSLLSFDLPEGDILVEYYYQGIVLRSSIWNPDIPANVNAMLSIVMTAPIYSLVLNLSTVWVFKIIYPLFFCLVPLALFQAYRKQTDDKLAFLAAFFFMSMPVFFSQMALVPRHEVAELFLALSILLFLDKKMASPLRALLLIIFGFSIVVSHYGTSYIYMFYLLIALPLLLLWRSSTVNKAWRYMVTRLGKLRHALNITSQSSKLADRSPSGSPLTATYVALFIVFCLAWYMYVSSGSPFDSIVRIGDHVYSSLSTEFFSLSGREAHVMQALGLMPVRSTEVEWSSARIFQYITQFFIVVGVIGLILNHRKTKFHPEYIALTLVSAVILGLCIALPYFVQAFNMMRMYHITLFLLAPFCVLGGRTLFYWLVKLFSQRSLRSLATPTYIKMVVILVLVPYFLFTTGFIFELTGATPTSRALSLYKADWPIFTKAETQASDWLLKIPMDKKVYGDSFSVGLMHYHYEVRTGVKAAGFPNDVKGIDNGSYIFLRRWNVIHGEILPGRETGKAFIYKNLEEIGLVENPGISRIYDNNKAQIWWCSK